MFGSTTIQSPFRLPLILVKGKAAHWPRRIACFQLLVASEYITAVPTASARAKGRFCFKGNVPWARPALWGSQSWLQPAFGRLNSHRVKSVSAARDVPVRDRLSIM